MTPEIAKDRILEMLCSAHRTCALANNLDFGMFPIQRNSDARTSEDGVYGHSWRIIEYIRALDFVRPCKDDAPPMEGAPERLSWDQVDNVIWDNGYGYYDLPALKALIEELYDFDDEALAARVTKRWPDQEWERARYG